MGRKARVTREQVLRAAHDAFLERGYDGTTLAEIGGRLGVSPAALLRHAPTKAALFTAAMGVTPGPEMLPLEFLNSFHGGEDPRRVLRQAAHAFVPFIQAKIGEVLTRWVHFKTLPGAGKLPLPFDPQTRPNPPQRNLGFLENYFRRAKRKGRLRIRDERAAALAFLSTLHSYVMLQEVLQILEKPLPLEDYLDTVIDVWTRGAIRERPRARRTP